jgi:hypothetical protein
VILLDKVREWDARPVGLATSLEVVTSSPPDYGERWPQSLITSFTLFFKDHYGEEAMSMNLP